MVSVRCDFQGISFTSPVNGGYDSYLRVGKNKIRIYNFKLLGWISCKNAKWFKNYSDYVQTTSTLIQLIIVQNGSIMSL
jgi:hypothetical protein